MLFDKINTLTVILLLALMELFLVLFLIYDFIIDSHHHIELSLVFLNTFALVYYLNKNKTQIRCCYQKIHKIVGKYK